MNKVELVAAIVAKTGNTQKDTAALVDAFTATVTEAMQAGDKVTLVGFGSFEARDRAERTARNPQDGSTIVVPACKVPKFKAGSALKNAINE